MISFYFPDTSDFPYKLHCMLEEVEKYNDQHIVSWQPDGKSFRVYRPDDFVNKIMPQYFHQTQYRSFQRMVSRGDNMHCVKFVWYLFLFTTYICFTFY
jgi:hypothetical protein